MSFELAGDLIKLPGQPEEDIELPRLKGKCMRGWRLLRDMNHGNSQGPGVGNQPAIYTDKQKGIESIKLTSAILRLAFTVARL